MKVAAISKALVRAVIAQCSRMECSRAERSRGAASCLNPFSCRRMAASALRIIRASQPQARATTAARDTSSCVHSPAGNRTGDGALCQRSTRSENTAAKESSLLVQSNVGVEDCIGQDDPGQATAQEHDPARRILTSYVGLGSRSHMSSGAPLPFPGCRARRPVTGGIAACEQLQELFASLDHRCEVGFGHGRPVVVVNELLLTSTRPTASELALSSMIAGRSLWQIGVCCWQGN